MQDLINKVIQHAQSNKPFKNRAHWSDNQDDAQIGALSDKVLAGLLYHVRPRTLSEVIGVPGISFQNADVVRDDVITVGEAITLWSYLTLIKTERETQSRINQTLDRDKAVDDANRVNEYLALIDFSSVSSSADALTEDDILDLDYALTVRSYLERGDLPPAGDVDKNRLKRGSQLMADYKIVKGNRQTQGVPAIAHDDAIISTWVDAGHLAGAQQRRLLGIAKR